MSGRWQPALPAALLTVLALAGTAGIASAHGSVGGGIEAPIPLWLLYAGSGLTVAVTAGWLAVGERRPADLRTDWAVVVPPWVARGVALVGRVLGLLVLVAVVAGGLLGPQVQSENVATVLFWPLWLKGLGLVAIFVGSPWRIVSPWATLYDGLAWLEGRDPVLVGDYPDRLGVWPALLGFLALVGILENLTTVPRSPRLTAAVVAGYALVMVLGALAFGRPWLRSADTFAVLYRLFARVSPLTVERGGGRYRLTARAPWRACTRPVADLSVVAFVVAAVYTVSFDGMTETPEFQTLLTALTGSGGPTATAVGLYVVGFALFLVSYALAVWGVDRVGGETGWDTTATAFAGSVVPIAAAYEVAHTYPFVLRNLGTFVGLATGGVLTPSLTAWLPVAGFWASQVVLVVGGHLVAVVAAHAVASNRYGPAAGRRAHLPLVVVMVGYTVLSLWIVSQPVVA
jgi:hypothetical protein